MHLLYKDIQVIFLSQIKTKEQKKKKWEITMHASLQHKYNEH